MAQKSVWSTVVALALLGAGWLVFESDWLDDVPAASGPASERLAALKVAPAGTMDGYSRESFEHWVAQPQAGRNCNTREAVLERDGTGVRVNGACEATSGSWTSAYNGERISEPSKIDIDHTVPLANAWRSGAREWSVQRREEFANDLRLPQLLAVDAGSNRAKGDQDPSTWKPSRSTFWCTYARAWIQVKWFYGLTLQSSEKTALQSMLNTC